MDPDRSIILGFMVAWDIPDDQKPALLQTLQAEPGWVTPTTSGNSVGGRSLSTEFGVSVKWGRDKVTGILTDAMLPKKKAKKDQPKEMTPNQMWQDVLAFVATHPAPGPKKVYAFVAQNLSAFGDGLTAAPLYTNPAPNQPTQALVVVFDLD